jgi:ribosomal protein S18 acetylase RimI-like enzyme
MFRKELYVFDRQQRPRKALIRGYTEEDFDGLIDIQRECFLPPFPAELWWNVEQLQNHVSRFPDGALCVEVEGRLAGSITGLVVQWEPDDSDHAWSEITDHGYIRNHDPNGNTLYIVDISVRPAYRELGLGKWLMLSMYDVVIEKKLTRLLGGARMPGYHKLADKISPEGYLHMILAGDLSDPIVSFLLRCGRVPVRVIPNYLDDEESGNNAVLMEWRNPFVD